MPAATDPSLRRARREILGLAALAGTLAALAGWQMLAPAEEPGPGIAMPVARPFAGPGAPAGAAAPAPPELAEILERPVFAPGRRRMVAIAEAQAAPPPPPAPSRPPLATTHLLLGWASSDGQLIAWLRPQGSGQVLRLRVGEELDGWTLTGTAGRRALAFERNGVRQTLGTAGAAAETPDEDAVPAGDIMEDEP